MKRLLLLALLLAAGGGLVWHAYQAGWLRSPLKQGNTVTAATDKASLSTEPPTSRRHKGGSAGGGRFGGDDDNAPIPVLAEAARYEDVPVTLDAVGTIQALNTVTIRSQVDGRLIELDFKDGDDVRRGDVLARIDPTTYQAQYDQAVAKKAQDEAQLANARVDLQRYAKLATTEYGSRQQADTQKALVAQLEAQIKVDQGVIDNDKAILDYTTIKSPIDGRTGIRLIDAGNIVHATDQTGIVIVTQLQPIAMIFNLPQQQLLAVNEAMAKGPVAVEALASDNSTVIDKGTIEVVDNQVDQATGTVKIKATFANSDRHLWPGEFVNVRVFVSVLPHVVVIPSGAVQRGPNGAYVYVVKDDGTVKLTLVTIGQQDENRAVVLSGIEPPARVVTTGFARLTDGARVTVTVADQTGAAASETATPAASMPPPASGEPPRRPRRGQAQSQPPAPTDPPK